MCGRKPNGSRQTSKAFSPDQRNPSAGKREAAVVEELSGRRSKDFLQNRKAAQPGLEERVWRCIRNGIRSTVWVSKEVAAAGSR